MINTKKLSIIERFVDSLNRWIKNAKTKEEIEDMTNAEKKKNYATEKNLFIEFKNIFDLLKMNNNLNKKLNENSNLYAPSLASERSYASEKSIEKTEKI